MDKIFPDNESLFRAVYPPEINKMFWKDNTHISSAAFLDKKGLSVERGNFRNEIDVVDDMKKSFIGRIVSFAVKLCREINAEVLYKPTKRSIYHSEIHGRKDRIVLSPAQRRVLAQRCKIVN